MKAETTRRPLLPACASALRMKCTRQRCQLALSTLLMVALMPSCASDTTSLTPRRPRRASLRRNAVQNVSASEGPMSMPRISRRPSLLTPTATITATETILGATTLASVAQAHAKRFTSRADGAFRREMAPTLAMTSEMSIATAAVLLPDMTKTPTTRTIAKTSSNAWKTKIPRA